MADQNFQIALDTTIRTEVEGLDPKAITINGPEDREKISNVITDVRYIKSRVMNFFKEMKENAHKPWKGIVSLEKSYTDKCDEFERAANAAILTYDQAKEEERQVEERRLQAIKNEEARKERDRLAQIAAKQRQAEDEARAKAEAARKAAEDAKSKISTLERARLVREAEEAERKAAAARAKAEAKETEAANTVPEKVNIASTLKREEGESVRSTWKARVINAALVPRAYLMVNETALDKQAKATQNTIEIPGVVFFEEKTIVRRNTR